MGQAVFEKRREIKGIALLHTDNTRDIPIAFITGLLQKEDVSKREGYIHGFPFITKPITKDELVQQVDSVFAIIRTEKTFIESLERNPMVIRSGFVQPDCIRNYILAPIPIQS